MQVRRKYSCDATWSNSIIREFLKIFSWRGNRQAIPGEKSLPIPMVIINENMITTSHAFDFTK